MQFLGWQLARMAGGFDLAANSQLAKDIIEDAGLLQSRRKTNVPGYKDRTNDETPCSSIEHKYYRT